ncbi:MAG TPA: hypothetical protein VFG19_01240 [Geobacteraceae bacterium]|nr:hypothetical protein [Geobacteraceae bacterium]
MGKASRTLILPAIVCILSSSAVLHAVTYPFPVKEPSYWNENTVMRPGAKVYLFFSGSTDKKSAPGVNDILAVFREYPRDISSETVQVGKVRITSLLGEHYLAGEVIGGEIQPGNIAMKGNVACYILSLRRVDY